MCSMLRSPRSLACDHVVECRRQPARELVFGRDGAPASVDGELHDIHEISLSKKSMVISDPYVSAPPFCTTPLTIAVSPAGTKRLSLSICSTRAATAFSSCAFSVTGTRWRDTASTRAGSSALPPYFPIYSPDGDGTSPVHGSHWIGQRNPVAHRRHRGEWDPRLSGTDDRSHQAALNGGDQVEVEPSKALAKTNLVAVHQRPRDEPPESSERHDYPEQHAPDDEQHQLCDHGRATRGRRFVDHGRPPRSFSTPPPNGATSSPTSAA